jgi:hypothetical protein
MVATRSHSSISEGSVTDLLHSSWEDVSEVSVLQEILPASTLLMAISCSVKPLVPYHLVKWFMCLYSVTSNLCLRWKSWIGKWMQEC